jgi:hypothetical protein
MRTVKMSKEKYDSGFIAELQEVEKVESNNTRPGVVAASTSKFSIRCNIFRHNAGLLIKKVRIY